MGSSADTCGWRSRGWRPYNCVLAKLGGKRYGDCRSKSAYARLYERAVYRFFECRESKKDGRSAEEGALRVRARVSDVDQRPEGNYDGEEEVHKPLTPVGSNWRIPGRVEGAGRRGGRGGEQIL